MSTELSEKVLGKLPAAAKRFQELTRQLADPAITSNLEKLRTLSQEHASLEPLIQGWQQYQQLHAEIASHQRLLDDAKEDPQLKQLAEEELPQLKTQLEACQTRLAVLLVPKDPLDDANVILEVRAGSGGEEAALFAAELLRAYIRYAERQGWRYENLNLHTSEAGGFKEAVISIQGQQAYGKLKYESGVHRVQRVPKTESQGRIHTSAATVAVLPEAEEIQVELKAQDLRIDVYRASGPGGQSVNTTDSAVRITHLPSGISAQSQDEKSQHKNKSRAMKVLQARLFEHLRQEQQHQQTEQRRSLVGSGDRSERIRTYNFPQGRVTDHRIGLTLHKLEQVLSGELDELIAALAQAQAS